MPQAIFLAAASVVAAIGVTGTVAGILTGVIAVGAIAGITSLARSIFGSGSPKPSQQLQNIRQEIGSRMRDYGIVRSGGQYTFIEENDGTLGMVITLATGRHSEILEHQINGRAVNVVGGTVTGASFHGALHIYSRDGSDDQTAIAELTAKFPQWTANHRQRGCPHVALICDPVKPELFSEVYEGRWPEYTQVRRGVAVYDPREAA